MTCMDTYVYTLNSLHVIVPASSIMQRARHTRHHEDGSIYIDHACMHLVQRQYVSTYIYAYAVYNNATAFT